jgi:hypothetical protein
MPTFDSAHFIANGLYEIGTRSFDIADQLIRLDVNSRNTIANILDNYSNLEVILRGSAPDHKSKHGKYTLKDVAEARAKLLSNVDSRLDSLIKSVLIISDETRSVLQIAEEMAGEVDYSSETTDEELERLGLVWLIPWLSASKLKRKGLVKQKSLADQSLESVKGLRDQLTALSSNLVSFHETLRGSREAHVSNSDSVLTTEDMLEALNRSVAQARGQVSNWHGFGS